LHPYMNFGKDTGQLLRFLAKDVALVLCQELASGLAAKVKQL
jgi:hypothetical protein